jgi:hypothetical protein
MLGLTDDPEGLHALRYLRSEHAFRFGIEYYEIGQWVHENGYRLKLCHREKLVIDGVERDFTSSSAILMRNDSELFAFRMRWF